MKQGSQCHMCCLLQQWPKVAELMGDKNAFQCYMIYNDQKEQQWFQQYLAAYGRVKRRLTGNSAKGLSFLGQTVANSSTPEAAPKSRGDLHLLCTLPCLCCCVQH